VTEIVPAARPAIPHGCTISGGGGNRTRATFPPLRYVSTGNVAAVAERSRLTRALEGRDGKDCFYCGYDFFTPRARIRHFDHVTPRPRGSDDIENIVIACAQCNFQKSTAPAWFFVFKLHLGVAR
jgi:hypothetical protein